MKTAWESPPSCVKRWWEGCATVGGGRHDSVWTRSWTGLKTSEGRSLAHRNCERRLCGWKYEHRDTHERVLWACLVALGTQPSFGGSRGYHFYFCSLIFPHEWYQSEISGHQGWCFGLSWPSRSLEVSTFPAGPWLSSGRCAHVWGSPWWRHHGWGFPRSGFRYQRKGHTWWPLPFCLWHSVSYKTLNLLHSS